MFRVDDDTRSELEQLAQISRRDFSDFMRLMAEDAVKDKYNPSAVGVKKK